MMGKLSANTLSTLQSIVNASTSDPETSIPGTTVVVVDKNGDELFAHASGKRGYGRSEDMTLDNIYWIASCTKMIAGIACMQLVEKGILALDDVEQVEKLCPELKAVKVLQDDGKLVEKERGITLRMLLTHTAGFGYTFFNEKLRDYNKPVGYDEFSGHIYDITQPLVHQPGTAWEYGVNIDWAGILLQRATGTSLNDYIHKNILEPLKLSNISMFPNQSMKDNLADMNYRTPDGKLSRGDHINRRPLLVTTEEEIQNCLNSGGAGCFAKPQEYCQILATLLNNGTSPKTGAQILKKETVDQMFTNQIPNMPNFGRKEIPDAKIWLTNRIPELYPVGDKPQGWGLTFMITGGGTGRSEGTVYWAGLPNLWWWCDRENGVAGMVACQILPFADLQTLGLWANVEATVYKALSERGGS